jgi:hypothetical protein
MQDPIEQGITVSGGGCSEVSSAIQLDPVSLADPDFIRIVVWAQQEATSGPAEVYQAAQMRWPLQQAPELASIEIEPATSGLEVGGQVIMTATGMDQSGDTMVLTNPVWAISDSAGGTFEPVSGSTTVTFTAGNPGSYLISCAEDGIEGYATVSVVSSLRPSPRRVRARY